MNCLEAPPEDIVAPCISMQYKWHPENRLDSFPSWPREIEYAKACGYNLVPPEYVLPHWSVKMVMERVLPKLYALRNSGFAEYSGPAGRPAREFDHPLFFKEPVRNAPKSVPPEGGRAIFR